jgi:hypothetical protein
MKNYFLILFLVVLFGCELIVDVDVPFEHPQLTLNSFFSPDSLWSANLSLNRHILNDSSSFERLGNGVIVIFNEGQPVDTLIHQGNGLYSSDTGKPQVGINYEISATTPDHGMVMSRSIIPAPAPIVRAEITETDPNPDDGNNAKLKITFQDNGAETNYYQILVEEEYEFYDYSMDKIHTTRFRIHLESEDPAIRDEQFNWSEGILLKDVLFNGREIEFSFNTYVNNFNNVAILLRTVSEDYYNYKSTFQLQDETSGDPFAQPVNVHNNIENGFGIFAGFSESRSISGDTPRPVITGISPEKGKPGDELRIYGENFIEGQGIYYYTVMFGSGDSWVHALPIRISDNELKVIVPDRATTGKVVVYAGRRIAVSETEFEVTQ